MEINYIFGNNKTGKTSFIVDIVKKLNNDKQKVLVVVPEQINLTVEKLIVDKIGTITNTQVYSFLRLSNKIFQESGTRQLTNLEETGKVMLLKLIVNKNEKKFKYYKKSSFNYGFISEVSEFISEVFKNNITTEEIQQIIDNDSISDIIRFKLYDILLIIKDYSKYLDEKLFICDDTLNILTDKLSDSKYMENINVVFDGFYGFTDQEYNIINKILTKAKSVTFTFNVNVKNKTVYFNNINKFDPYFETKKMVNKISDIINENKLKISNIKILDEKLDTKKDIDYLKANYFAYKKVESFQCVPQNIKLIFNKNKVDECINISKQICNLINNGYKFSDIKIICGDISEYKTVLKGIFIEYGILFFIDEKDTIMLNSLVRLILTSLTAISTNFSFESVMNLIKIDLFYTNDFEELEIEIFENYLLEYGIKGYQFKNEFAYGKNNKNYNLEAINNTRIKIIHKLEPILNNFGISKKYSVMEFSTKLYNFLEFNNILEKIQVIINCATNDKNFKRKSEYEQIWGKFISLLEKIVEILGDEQVTIKEFHDILKSGFETITLGVIPFSQNEVIVSDYQRSKLSKTKVVFILGAKDTSFPIRPKESSVISDNERKMLNSENQKIITSSELFLKQNLLIYDCLVSAGEKLFLSYSYFSLDGSENTQALVFKKICEMYPKIQSIKNDNMIVTNKKMMLSYAIQILKKDENCISEKEKQFLDAYKADNNYKDKIEIIEKVLKGYLPDQLISSQSIHNTYGSTMQTSISKLEKYVKCPFAYFLEYNLKLKDRKTFEILHLDIGNIFHEILDEFTIIIKDRSIKFEDVEYEIIDELVEQIVSNLDEDKYLFVFNNSYRYINYLERIKNIAKSSIYALSKHLKHGKFDIFKSELSFGSKEISEIIINIDDEKKIKLTGKIDRVDIYEDDEKRYVKIIDFKTGFKQYDEKEVLLGTQIQLLTYLDILIKQGNKIFGGSKVYKYIEGGVYYFEIKNPSVNYENGDTPDKIKEKLFKEFSLQGVTNADDKIVFKVDENLENKGKSNIIPVSIKKDGDFSKNSKVYTTEQFSEIREKVNKKIIEISKDIYSGKIDIDYNKADELKVCKYCDFSGICKRDKAFTE